MPRRVGLVFNIIAVMALLIQGVYITEGQAASQITLEGTFIAIWGDGAQGRYETRVEYFLAIDQHGTIKLLINDELLSSVGGAANLNRKAVEIYGMWQADGKALVVQGMTLAEGEKAGINGVFGPQPWVSILCKFADRAQEPKDLAFFRDMYGSVYPRLDDFWRQNSYNLANLQGSAAFGWYVLPHNRDYYVYNEQLDWGRAAVDCTSVADADVYYPDYVGINLMFNDVLDCCAWGGGWLLNLDGHYQVWRMTWEPPWGYQNIGVIGHETGHGFGLPHSLGNCQAGYDNRWDVLSDVWNNGSDPKWGTVGQHTIAYHKGMVEWINSKQQFISKTGSLKTITLERLASPQTSNYLEARILINDQNDHFYTLEVRQPTDELTDYDKWLPGFAVIIHDVIPSRGEPAVVIDQDGDCYTGDEGAMYKVGETFLDEENGISVTIDAATATGYIVTINNRYILMEGVDISGANLGYLGENIPFTATVSPEDATTPITYTWEATGFPPIQHVGEGIDPISYTWDEVGTKAITVTAENAGGSVVDIHSIDIAKKVPVVSLSGPLESSVGRTNIFTATVEPADAALPITYVWEASSQLPITDTTGLTDVVSYTWEAPGIQVITVTVMNVDGSTADVLSIPVYMAPQNLEIDGPEVGKIDESYTFTGMVSPITSTVPITYVWTVDGQAVITDTTGITDTTSFSWELPGYYRLEVSASNQAGTVIGIRSIMIYIRTFLPISMRN